MLLARQAMRARRRITRRTTKQRMIDTRKLLKKLRLLAKEVRSHRSPDKSQNQHYVLCVQGMKPKPFCTTLPPAPDHHPRCVPLVTQWEKAFGLCQGTRLLHPLLTGGGAEGAGQWPCHHTLHEGTASQLCDIFIKNALHSFQSNSKC